MRPRKGDNHHEQPDDELRELNGFPDKIRQIDLAEIIRLRYRLRLVKEELASLEEQIRAQITLGLPLEEGRLTLKTWGGRDFEINPAKEDQ